MAFQISIQPGGQRFEAHAGEALLDAALRHGLRLPYGCRDGACGACRGRVLSGIVDHGKAQDFALNEAERAAGWALFCSASAKSDLVIESLEVHSALDLPVKTLPVRIERLTRAAPGVMLIEFKLPADERLQFLPGQYVDVLLKGGARRAFSLANAPGDEARLQLHVRRQPGGLFTDHVFGALKERDILRINGPHGSFYLREESTKPALLIAGGTGFAPIKSIVEYALLHSPGRQLVLYWGGRRLADLYLLALAEGWAREHAQFSFVPVLSEAEPQTPWAGRTGLVHHAVMADHPDLSGHQVYVCGSPAMVAAARHDLIERCRLPEDEFFADAFELAAPARNEPSP